MQNFLALLVCLIGITTRASAGGGDTVVNIKEDFGAQGNGLSDDHQAFQEASSFLNSRRGNATLIIPAGTYIVGRQLDYGVLLPMTYRALADGTLTNPYFKLGAPALFISGCEGVTIRGEKGSVIKFRDDMLLGGFEYDGKAIPRKDKQGKTVVPEQNRLAFTGDGICIENSKGVTISGLELDGNLEHLKIGGNISADGLQAGHTGISITESRSVSLEDLTVHHFAVDGLQIRNSTGREPDVAESQELLLSNCSFIYNGRQGFSWTGGAGLTATNCNFSHTGRGYNKSLKAALSTAPGAGVDIESESDPHMNTYRLVKNGRFINCRFENNTGAGMVADLYDPEHFRIAQGMSFESCTFWGTSFWSIWVSHPGFSFTGCHIYGSAVHSFNGTKPGMETKFRDCFFEDKQYIDEKGRRVVSYGSYLVEIADGIGTSFDKCTFTSHGKYYYYLVCSRPDDNKSKFVVNSCRFLNASGSNRPHDSIAEGVLFTGKNEYRDLPASE
jgi:hypothetical protein